MFTTHASRNRLKLFTCRVALVGVTVLAACDTDEPVAPSLTKVPTASQSAVIPIRTGAVRMTVVDDQGILVNNLGALFKVTDSQNNSWTVQDQLIKDSDAKVGVLLLGGLVPGSYMVCDQAPPTGYLLGKQPCTTVVVTAGTIKDAGTFVNPRYPRVSFSAIDFAGKLLGGAKFIIRDSVGTGINVVADNAVNDEDKADGKFKVVLPEQGKYTVCATQPPTAYHFPQGQFPYCKAFQVAYGQTQTVPGFVFVLPYSGRWGVTDGSLDINNTFTLIGPSSFKVYNPQTLSWISIDDNGWNDEDPTLGKISLPLPNGGSFSVCEVVPPPNHWNAQPNCKTMTVTLDVPAWAGWFVNPEKQVYMP